MKVLALLACIAAAAAAGPRDRAWCRFRGPAHGRASVARAPAPPLELAWTIDLWDPDDDGSPKDALLFEPGAPPLDGSPLGLGIAWRLDDHYLYAFETGFYSRGNKLALFDRRTGRLLSTAASRDAQPLPRKRAFSIHDVAGFAPPVIVFASFYSGQRFWTVRDRLLRPLDAAGLGVRSAGHSLEGVRWLTHGLYLDGAGAKFEEGPRYFWGNNLRRLGEPGVLLAGVSVPAVAWNDTDLVLYVRGGLSERTPRGSFTWREYVRVDLRGKTPAIARRVRVDDVFEDPPPGPGERFINRARDAVHALALSPGGRFVYCQERIGSDRQRLVRRRLSDFSIDADVPAHYLPPVSEAGFYAHANPELGIGWALDAGRVHLQLPGRLEAYTPDFRRRLYRVPLPPRTLNAHTPFAMNRLTRGTQEGYACRGTETTLAAGGKWLYLTTDTTLQVHEAATGRRVWSFDLAPLLPVVNSAVKGRGMVRRTGLPGDVMLAPDAVYVATHRVQSRLFCFVPAGATPR